MAEVKLHITQGDSAPDWQFTVKRDGAVVNLTGATKVELKLHSTVDGSITNSADDDCTIDTPTSGLVTYNLKTTDTPHAGVFLGDLVVTFSPTQVETDPDYVVIYARPKAGTIS